MRQTQTTAVPLNQQFQFVNRHQKSLNNVTNALNKIGRKTPLYNLHHGEFNHLQASPSSNLVLPNWLVNCNHVQFGEVINFNRNKTRVAAFKENSKVAIKGFLQIIGEHTAKIWSSVPDKCSDGKDQALKKVSLVNWQKQDPASHKTGRYKATIFSHAVVLARLISSRCI